MTYNYHTHTYLCSHASGTPEEYVLKAIEGGITHMGFSEHMPHICKNGYEAWYRLPVNKVQSYIDQIESLRQKYQDKIKIIVGFEMEYFENVFDQMLSDAVMYGGEYLIFGAHYLDEMGAYCGEITNDPAMLTRYADNVVKAIETGVFTYVAHPDLISFTGDEDLYEEQMTKICKASKQTGIPLEINFLGIRANRHYPTEAFWKIAGKEKCPVTFGFDAHDAYGACDLASLSKANELVKKYDLNYIGEPNIIYINK